MSCRSRRRASLELDHDFLWRHQVRAARARPHRHLQPLALRGNPRGARSPGIPRPSRRSCPSSSTRNIWRERFEDIRAWERYLARNGTVILKFFLNVSKEEQRQRFLDRLEEPGKRWKFSMGDVDERRLWDKYMAAYQDTIHQTSTPREAPWHVVPADHKWFARVVIGSTIVERYGAARPAFPKVDKALDARVRPRPRGAGAGGAEAVPEEIRTPRTATRAATPATRPAKGRKADLLRLESGLFRPPVLGYQSLRRACVATKLQGLRGQVAGMGQGTDDPRSDIRAISGTAANGRIRPRCRLLCRAWPSAS